MLHIIMGHYDFMLYHFANTFFVIRHLVIELATFTLLYMLLLHSFTQYTRGGGQGQLNFIFIQHMYVCALAGIYNQT